MSKPKDHLFDLEDLLRSVLLGDTATAECGFEKTFTREDLERLEYGTGCKDCFAAAGAKVGPEPMSILPKLGWVGMLERSWRNRHEDGRRSQPVYKAGPVTAWIWTSAKVTSNASGEVKP